MSDQPAPDRPESPPFVYLPCTTHVQDPADAVIEFRRVTGDRLALMVYSSLDQLKSCCGEGQPWLAVPTPVLEHLGQVHPYELALLDVALPEEHRREPLPGQPTT